MQPPQLSKRRLYTWLQDERSDTIEQYLISSALIVSGVGSVIQVVRFGFPAPWCFRANRLYLGTGLVSLMGTSVRGADTMTFRICHFDCSAFKSALIFSYLLLSQSTGILRLLYARTIFTVSPSATQSCTDAGWQGCVVQCRTTGQLCDTVNALGAHLQTPSV